jgi:transposase InsO family protein
MKVSTSAYYAWRSKREPTIEAEEVFQAAQVKDCFEEHRCRYGARRIVAELKSRDIKIGRFKVRRLMREQNLVAITSKKFKPKTTDSRHNGLISPNLLKEVSNQADQAGQVIVGDITYLAMADGKWCYLAIWQDKYTRRIVGWAVSERMTAELVTGALEMGLRQGVMESGAIIHTDRGSQYVSDLYRNLLKRCGFRQSMSGKGNCYDNAQAESFFSRFKTELVEDGIFEDVETARAESFDYIECYYNRKRRHSGIGYKIPMEFEQELKIEKQRRKNESKVSCLT